MALTFVNQVGAVEGMNQAAPGTLIPETFVRFSQDVLFDRAGLMRRRGPFEKFKMYNANNTENTDGLFDHAISGVNDERILAVLSTYDPIGAERIGMLVDSFDATTNQRETILRVFDNSFKYLGYQVLPFDVPPLSIVTAKPALGGGLWVSIVDDPANADSHYQFFWRGGYNSYMTVRSGTFTAAGLQNSGIPGSSGNTNDWAATHKYYSKTISVDSAGLSVGMFVYVKDSANYYYVGTISAIQGAGNITLEKHPFIWNSGYNNNKTFATDIINVVFTSVRPYEHLHGRGLLNTEYNNKTITSGDLGTSAEGHWKSANVATYFVYRASDNISLGKIERVTDNKTAVLVAEPGTDIKADEYIMKPVVNTPLVDPSAFKVDNRAANTFAGLYTAVYAGYQWYGNFAKDDQNTNRVVFSAAHDREAVDLSPDAADSIIFPGKSKFRGLGASSAGLLVFLEDRTYILRGNERTNFSVEQLVPEGCLCASSIVEYGGGVFWAGKSGIMFFDGVSVRNLTKDNLGLFYTDSLDVFNPEQDRIIGFIHKNNLIMHYTAWKSPTDPIRYEPIYAADWQNTDGIMDRAWDEFDPDFDYDDFFTENNTPIYWDQVKLNNPEESASTGEGFKWNDGTNWESTSNIYKWGPLRKNTSMTFCVYLPTNAVTTLSNIDPRGMTSIETTYGLKTIVGVNSVENSVSYNVSNKALTSNVATLTLGNHNLIVGNSVTVANVDDVFDGIYTITAVTSTTISYAKTNANITSAAVTGGTVTLSFSNRLRARLIDIHPVFDTNTNGMDPLLVEKINLPYSDLVKGPDFYLQSKHFTVGDPILKKWFQRVMLSMLLYDGAIRMDLIDDDDNDEVDINKKKHRNWEIFTEKGYNWDYLGKGEGIDFGVVFPKLTSPNKSTWSNVEAAAALWDELFTADFNRYIKRTSWRKASVGLRLYQLNKYKKPYHGVVTVPNRLEIQGFTIGFKPLRQGRI